MNQKAPFGARDYFQSEITSSEVSDAKKLKLIRQLGNEATQNLAQKLKETYQKQYFQSDGETQDDEKFIKEAEQMLVTLVSQLIDIFVNDQKQIDIKANDTTLAPLTALLAFASINDLDHILDTSNGFITGLEDGGQYNIDSPSGRKAALNEIAEDLKFNDKSTNYRQTII